MADLARDSSSPPMSPSSRSRRKSFARKLERFCCTTFAYIPLLFVYGLTTWAIYVEVRVSFLGGSNWLSYVRATLGLLLYGLGNASYTIAVFTSPGSPLDAREDRGGSRSKHGGGYEGVPTYEHDDDEETVPAAHSNMTTVTAKSTGKPRYCKKCHSVKPDRAHHCSTCGRCVLKMDHHCPWLATCVGLRNYKPFLLFLIYISLFCWLCFGVCATWTWAAITDDKRMQEGMIVVHTILLAVLGGIIGLVLSGFTGWHIYLAVTGQTTIESLEKTRYLSPLRKSMAPDPDRNYVSRDEEGGDLHQEQSLLEHLKDTHANALPGVLRPEEGEATPSRSATPNAQPSFSHTRGMSDSPARDSLHGSYASLEAQREQERYQSYLDEQDSEKMPNAFDMGWKRNLTHVFGDQRLYWFLPVCNTSGDGWMWEVSPKWTEARAEMQERRQRDGWRADAGVQQQIPSNYRWTPGQGFVDQRGYNGPPGGSQVQMQPLDRRKADPGDGDGVDNYDTESDEDTSQRVSAAAPPPRGSSTNWNDVPDEYLMPVDRRKWDRSRGRGRRKGD